MKRSYVTYEDTFEYIDWEYDDYISNGKTVADWEDEQVAFCGYTFVEYEVDRLITFIAMGYIEIKNGGLSDRLKYELELDVPVWDSGEIDKFLDDEEKKLIYEHLAVIKEYLNNKGIYRPGETQ